MKTRRQFLETAAVTAAASVAARPARASAGAGDATGAADRAYWVSMLERVAEPVLSALAANELRRRMPVEAPANTVENRRVVTHLEAVGRTLAGIAPWLELTGKPAAEEESARRLAAFARQGLAHATDPAAADFLNFTAPARQPLVDAAFLAHALLRARRELWESLDAPVQGRVVAALQQTREIVPANSNWLLFSAMVEAFCAAVGAQWREAPVDRALVSHEGWYKGDGAYGDGPEFHWDYYNSFVIQPFLIDVLEHVGRVTPKWSALTAPVIARARRMAAVQERLIASDGSYPPLGRSIAYRCGAFQLLAQMALRRQLPDGVSPAQVRGALTAVIRRTLDAPGTFDSRGWLQVGLAGHQPGLAESYISTGSLYLCTFAFLPLGLPASDPFWSDPPAEWTQRKAWSGRDLPADHALSESH
jgi:hypothetical protein